MYISLRKKLDKTKKYLIIGPGTSGKSTLIKELTGGKYGRNSKEGKNIHTFKDYNILFLAPNYGPKKHEININAWIKVLNEEKAAALVCYVPRHIHIKRLVKRLKERWLKDIASNNVIDELVNALIDKNVNNVDDKLNEIGNKYGSGVKNKLMKFFCKDMFFSYDELYKELNKNNIEFYIINTFSEEERV